MAKQRIWAPWRLRYVKDATDSDECIFCTKPAQGDDREALIVHRGERCYVILNLFPYTNGHLMVAPFEHIGKIQEIAPAVTAEMMALAQRAIGILEDVYEPGGLQHRRQPGSRRRRRRRGPHPSPRRPALGGRQQLHAGGRGHEGHAAVAGRELRRTTGRLHDDE